MATETTGLLTASKIAKQLGASYAKVKKAIQSLGLKPKAKKGVCSYYGKEVIARVKQALKA